MDTVILSEDQHHKALSTNRAKASPVQVYLASLRSTNSKRNQRSALLRIIETMRGQSFKSGARYTAEEMAEAETMLHNFPWHEFDYDKAMALKAALVENGYSPRTINPMLAALRKVLEVCYRREWMDRQTLESVQDALKYEAVDTEALAGREITQRERGKLKAACLADTSAAGVRDAALIGLLFSGMMRRFELAKATVADYDQETGNLTVVGKRSKTRLVRASAGVRELLAEWLKLRGTEPGALLVPVNKSGSITKRIGEDGQVQGMSAQSIRDILKKRAEKAGIDPDSIATHDFRRTAITELWRRGVPGPQIQRLAGHADISTTARYDRSKEAEALAAAENLEF